MNIFKNAPSMVLAAALVTLSGTSMAGVASTRAAFTDTAAAGTATFTTGTVDIALQIGAAGLDCSTGTFDESQSLGTIFSNMKPSDVLTKAVCVKNVGTLAVNYTQAAPTITGSSALAGQVKVRITKASSSSATCATGLDAAGANAGADTQISATATLSAIAVTSQSLATSAVDKLCYTFALPNTVTDDKDAGPLSIQGATANGAFSIVATNQ